MMRLLRIGDVVEVRFTRLDGIRVTDWWRSANVTEIDGDKLAVRFRDDQTEMIVLTELVR